VNYVFTEAELKKGINTIEKKVEKRCPNFSAFHELFYGRKKNTDPAPRLAMEDTVEETIETLCVVRKEVTEVDKGMSPYSHL
jgi:hypothetical protein